MCEQSDALSTLKLISPSLSDPYEQVVLPVDGLKEEEPVEPYQKIGPSKTVWSLFLLNATDGRISNVIQNEIIQSFCCRLQSFFIFFSNIEVLPNEHF